RPASIGAARPRVQREVGFLAHGLVGVPARQVAQEWDRLAVADAAQRDHELYPAGRLGGVERGVDGRDGARTPAGQAGDHGLREGSLARGHDRDVILQIAIQILHARARACARAYDGDDQGPDQHASPGFYRRLFRGAMRSSAIFLRSVLRLRPRIWAARTWLPSVCSSTSSISGRSTRAITSSYRPSIATFLFLARKPRSLERTISSKGMCSSGTR